MSKGIKELKKIAKTIKGVQDRMEKREKMLKTDDTQVIENLKCCGNCFHYGEALRICERRKYLLKAQSNGCCKYWRYDRLTREDRE